VLLTGAEGNFAAGADIAEIEGKTAAEGATDPRKAHWAAIRAFPKPLIAAVDGFALGGGFELALMADCLVLGATAKVGLPETNLGLIPGAGGAQRLLSLVGRARATRLVLTGEILPASTAQDWGIAGWLSEGAAEDVARPLAEKLADRAPLALQAAKAALVAGAEGALALDQERAGFEALLDTQDKTEGIRAFREKAQTGVHRPMTDRPTIGVVGLGTMGLGIAQVYAQAGFPVIATDAHQPARDSARDRLAQPCNPASPPGNSPRPTATPPSPA
jgi:enoyl-CoA hydratase